MKPMPTSEMATAFVSTKPGAARGFDKPKASSKESSSAADAKCACDLDLHGKISAKDAVSTLGKPEQPRSADTFDSIVSEFDEVKTDTSVVAMELASSQMSAVSSGLAAILQGIPVANSVGAAANPDSADAVQSPSANASQENVLIAVGEAGDDMARLAEQLAARAAALNRTAVSANDAIVRTAPAEEIAVDGKAAVTVTALQDRTGFDGAIRVTANQQRWFQSAAPVLTGVSNSMMRAESKLLAGNMSSVDSKPIDVAPEGGETVLPENAVEVVQSKEQPPSANGARDEHSSRDDAQRGRPADAATGASKTASGARSTSVLESNAGLAPPYQQVRAAVAEAVVAANAVPSTDYVSLYADRPASPHLTLKTLELSLQPPDLGRVNIKMNLAARDLKLEIETSKASTAQMLSIDQASLKRELLNDNADLSSVLVSVTSAVSDTGAARSAGNGEQQFAGNSRSANENAFGSTGGGRRDDHHEPRNSGFQEHGASRVHRDRNADDASVNASSKALYI